MKKSILILLASAASLTAQAADLPLLSRTSASGFVAPTMRRALSCEIYQDRIEISQSLGGITSRRSIPHTLLGGVGALIEEAKAGPFNPVRGIPDAGTISYTATSSSGEPVILKSVGFRGQENGSPAAATLEAFIDLICGN